MVGKELQNAYSGIARTKGMHEPDWEPLHKLFGPCPGNGQHSPACGFMFMGYAAGPAGSGGIRLYKHGITRRYLNLDEHCRAYRYNAAQNTYETVPIAAALEHVFAGLEELGATILTAYDEDYIRARNERLRAAGYSVLTLEPPRAS